MPSDHFTLWQAFHQLSPIDGSREDIRHGILCRLIAQVLGGEKTDVEDWIPVWGLQQETVNLEAFKAGFAALADPVEPQSFGDEVV